jgi:hypothetical protein
MNFCERKIKITFFDLIGGLNSNNPNKDKMNFSFEDSILILIYHFTKMENTFKLDCSYMVESGIMEITEIKNSFLSN